MTTHATAYKVIIPFGKYKGLSLGYINDTNKSYLEWLSTKDGMAEKWRNAALQTLANLPVDAISNVKASAPPRATLTYRKGDKILVKFEFDNEMVNRLKFEIDGRSWNKEEVGWEIPSTQIVKLVELFGGPGNIIADEKTKKCYLEEKERRQSLDILRVQDDTDIDIQTQIPLFGFQKVGVKFIDRAGGRAMVADSMGLGKTLTSIGYAVYKDFKTLVVVPKSVIANWVREIKRATGKKAVVWDGKGKSGRIDSTFHIVNYDVAEKHVDTFNTLGFDLLICDEATYLKNRKTKRARVIMGHTPRKKASPYAHKSKAPKEKKYPGIKTKHVIFLTGTPILNRPVEAFYLLNFLDKNRFNNFYHFVQKYKGWKGETPQNLDDLHHRTKDVVIRRLKKEVLNDLPDKLRSDIIVEMSDEDMSEYYIHLNKLFNTWQFSGKPTVADMPAIQRFLLKRKVPRAIELIDEMLESDRGILIFSVYIDPLKELQKHYGEKAVLVYGKLSKNQRQDSIDKLSDGRAKVGLFSIGAGSMGIDGVQNQIDTVLFLDRWWVPAVHEQGEDRLYRIGQKNNVQAFYFTCEGTIDEYMDDILKDKQKIIEQVTDGKIITGASSKSYFKEFVQRITMDFYKDKKGIDLSNVIDIDDTILE